MLGYQLFLEVFSRLKAHKIRTAFTGFGLVWAMLILVLLQGAGAGLYSGMVKRFHSYSDHVFSIRAGYCSGNAICLTEGLTDDLVGNLNLFDQIMPLFRTKRSVVYGEAVHKSGILGVRVGYEKIKHFELVEGRFFTERDLAERFPVCILGLKMKKRIFDTQAAVGQSITIDGTATCVVGVLEATAGMDDDQIIIPSSLFKALFPHHTESIDRIVAKLSSKQNPIEAEEKVRAYLARRLNVETQDLHISSASKRVRTFQILFRMMQAFIWFVSFCFLVSGVVAVGNMMLVVVKERTQELAIRKVVGAQPSDIMGLILLESIVINLISGILGLGVGISILQWMNAYLVPMFEKYGITRFEFEYSMVVAALVVLILSGCLAGMIPAKRALYIKPVKALNNE